ncbi:hypothetical protein EJ02DRAFT_458966 [Clathrospora elynae]|uniref:Uncharacterized protein n=1 Tax=Clathrospora elynae TaxID=706981 RepID=A0A6A5SAW6_9PLEO|nr:hypothetical protein EJ02DRAFT_458966 [Clathrospora elynae]
MNEFDNHADWQSHNIACMLEFIDKSFQQGDNLVTAAATSNTVIKMAQSPYLFFDCYENLSIFREFSLLVVPRINKHDPDGMSKQLKEIFKKVRTRAEASLTQVLSIRELERNIGLIEKMPEEYNWANSEDYHKVIPTVLEDLEGEIKEVLSQKLFDDLYDWSCRAVNRLIDGVTDGMKMGAPPSTQLATCNMIEAMVRSNKLFLDDNLKKLSFFLHRIGPAIDGMADARQSDRLTTLLDLLRNNPEVRTPQHRNEIKSIRRNLGRTYEDLESAASKAEVDRDVEDQLSSLASKLGLDP